MCLMKLAHGLKMGFLQIIEVIKGTRGSNEINEDGEEPKLEFTIQQVTVVQERDITLKAAKGSKRRGVPRGPPAQTG